jgi:DNA-binding transcriptional LysR family regulator
MMDLNALHTFLHVADEGSLAAAAIALNVPTSTVSRRVSRLEDDLGLSLLQRSGRGIVLTDDGRALARRSRSALQDLQEVQHGFADADGRPRGTLVATAPVDFGATPLLAGIIAEYARQFPQVKTRLRMTNRVTDLLDDGIDVAFRMHTGPLPPRDDLIARRLGSLTFGVYASRTYLQRVAAPQTWQDLGAHPIIAHSSATEAVLPTDPVITADDFSPIAALIAQGAGVGIVPDFVSHSNPELVRLDLDWPAGAPTPTLSLVWLRTRHLSPRVRSFVDVCVSQALGSEWLAR